MIVAPFPKWLEWMPKKFIGIAIYPHIYLREVNLLKNKTLLNHEKIHLAQQRELGLLKFLLLYVWEWVVKGGYRKINFEREAYANERDYSYLDKRRPYAYKNY